MSSKDKEKTVKPIVKVAEKKIPNRELDSFLDYVMAPERLFPLPAKGLLTTEGYLSETEPVLGSLKIHALFLRGKRDNDEKRKPRQNGKPYPSHFILSHGSCIKRLTEMEKQKKPHEQTQNAVDNWPENTEEIESLDKALSRLGLTS